MNRIEQFKAVAERNKDEKTLKIKTSTAFEIIEDLTAAFAAEFQLARTQIKAFVSHRKKDRLLFYFVGNGEAWEGAGYKNREKAKLFIKGMQK